MGYKAKADVRSTTKKMLVWAAFCERSYGGIGFTALFYAWVRSKAKAVSEGSKIFSHTQVDEQFLLKNNRFAIYL